MLKLRTSFVIVLMFVIGTACRATPSPSLSPSPTRSRPASTGQLKIDEPAPGSVFSTTTIHVKLELAGATIDPQTTTDLKPDKGHIHLSLDGTLVSMNFTLEQDVQASKGKHLINAEFVASDHSPFNPRVVVTTTFEVD